jgi:diaminohydroxyphosphoribosylaminopyrimidine deaminase/5-amino-6-(5-phosphoribosylamino)uracil reductase
MYLPAPKLIALSLCEQEGCCYVDDFEAMRQALLLAASVEGRTSPRPPVGALLLDHDTIIGRGATAPPYGPHAEIVALAEAGSASGATLYTTLEPCCVKIHTPPCTDKIIAAGIRRVVIGTLDPNPLVAGRGMTQLLDAGLEVSLLEDAQAAQLIRPFATLVMQQRPYVTAKWAMTLDGKIATSTHDAYWISGPESRARVHDLRDRVDAILIGSGTASDDDPQLTVRLDNTQQAISQRAPRSGPLRVVLATNGKLAADLKLLQSDLAQGTMIMVGESCPAEQRAILEGYGVKVCTIATQQDQSIDITAALAELAQQGYMHVLIEGGSRILGSAFDQHCVDHVAAFIAPKIVGGSSAISPVGGLGLSTMTSAWQLDPSSIQTIGADVLIEGDVHYA